MQINNTAEAGNFHLAFRLTVTSP